MIWPVIAYGRQVVAVWLQSDDTQCTLDISQSHFTEELTKLPQLDRKGEIKYGCMSVWLV